MKRKLFELQKKCCAKRRKVPTTVTETFTLANELFGSVEAYTSIVERATRLNCVEDPEVGLDNVTVERDRKRQALVKHS